MATISITYPDEYSADTAAALRDYLGEDSDGLSNAEATKKAVKRMVKRHVQSYRRRSAATVLLVWFMFRLERILSRFDKTVQLVARAVIRLLERTDPDEASALSKALYRADGGED